MSGAANTPCRSTATTARLFNTGRWWQQQPMTLHGTLMQHQAVPAPRANGGACREITQHDQGKITNARRHVLVGDVC